MTLRRYTNLFIFIIIIIIIITIIIMPRPFVLCTSCFDFSVHSQKITNYKMITCFNNNYVRLLKAA